MPSAVCCLPSAVCRVSRPSSAVCRPSSAIYRLPSAAYCMPSAVCRPLYAFCCLSHLPSAVCRVYRLLSAVYCMPSVICHLPCAFCCLLSLSVVCRLLPARCRRGLVSCLLFTVCCLRRCLYRPPHRYFCALHPTPPHHTTRRILSGKKAHPQLAGGLFSAYAWPALFRFIQLTGCLR